jgi:hypothetical protein
LLLIMLIMLMPSPLRFDLQVWFTDNATYHSDNPTAWVGDRAYNNHLVGSNNRLSGSKQLTLAEWQALNSTYDVGSTCVRGTTGAPEVAKHRLLSFVVPSTHHWLGTSTGHGFTLRPRLLKGVTFSLSAWLS